MGKIVNLRNARKLKRRAEAERAADANRALHGRTKAEKQTAQLAELRAEARLEGHRREDRDA